MTQEPKPWRDMTPEEKGALLLAHHEGKDIECVVFCDSSMGWCPIDEPSFAKEHAYRIRPEPKREVRSLYVYANEGDFFVTRIGTVDLIDGKPDPASIKIEELT